MTHLAAAIESLEPGSAALWLVFAYAAVLYPLGLMLGSSCCCGNCQVCEGSQCCGDDYPPPGNGICCDGEWHETGDEEPQECGGVLFASNYGKCETAGGGNDTWQDGHFICCGDQLIEIENEVVPPPCGGTAYVANVGYCDSGVWQEDAETTCCNGDLKTSQDEGECCGGAAVGTGYWHAPGEEGTCCTYTPDGSDVEVAQWCPQGSRICDDSICCCVTNAWECADVCCVEGEVPYLKEGSPPECKAKCCDFGVCNYVFSWDCDGIVSQGGPCIGGSAGGCPVPCCTENPDGDAECEITTECQPPRTFEVGPPGTCEGSTCGQGACCVVEDANVADLGTVSCDDADGECVQGKTAAECAELGGIFMGPGTTACDGTGDDGGINGCRSPFDTACCESITSTTGSRLTFTQPRNKRSPPFSKTMAVTVSGYTDSKILVHGLPFGDDKKRCPISATFHLCWDKFDIEVLDCGGTFKNLDVTVCWSEQDNASETVDWQACNDSTVWLSQCAKNCATTIRYFGPMRTSNAAIEIRGDATIAGDGSGPLTLTGTISQLDSCAAPAGRDECRILTLSGSTNGNRLQTAIGDAAGCPVSFAKRGAGSWKLQAASSYTGSTSILAGTIVAAVNTPTGAVSGAFGLSNDQGSSETGRVQLGDTSGDATGTAALLLSDGIYFGKRIRVTEGSGQTIILGGANTSGTTRFAAADNSTTYIYVGRDVTLRAATGGVVEFGNSWVDSAGTSTLGDIDVTIGTSANAGTVRLTSESLVTEGSVEVNYGVLEISGTASISAGGGVTVKAELSLISVTDGLDVATPLTLEAGSLNLDGCSLTLNSLAIAGASNSSSSISVADDHELTVSSLDGEAGTTILKTGDGALRITGSNTFAGTMRIDAGTLLVEQTITNSAKIDLITFDRSTGRITMEFSGEDVESGDEFQVLYGPTYSIPLGWKVYGPSGPGEVSESASYNALTSTITMW